MFISRAGRWITLCEAVGSTLVIAILAIWLQTNLSTQARLVREDGPIESLTALFFGLAGLGFFVVLARSTFLREKRGRWRYLFTLAWAGALLFAMAEEISWGQRILGFETPQALKDANFQDEFTLHNIYLEIGDWSVQWFSLQFMTFVPGVFLPLLATTRWVRCLIQKLAFPVVPLGFAPLFLGSWLLQKIYHPSIYYRNDLMEIREFLVALGMLGFALHGALRPSDLFRLPADETSS